MLNNTLSERVAYLSVVLIGRQAAGCMDTHSHALLGCWQHCLGSGYSFCLPCNILSGICAVTRMLRAHVSSCTVISCNVCSGYLIDSDRVAPDKTTLWLMSNLAVRSLCIVDEFGKGTLTADGVGLLAASLHHFASMPVPPKLLACTHFSDLLNQPILHRQVSSCTIAPCAAYWAVGSLLDRCTPEASAGAVAHFPLLVMHATWASGEAASDALELCGQ